jgi:hypothetical protein
MKYFSGGEGLDKKPITDEGAHETPLHAHSHFQGNTLRHLL